MLVAWTLAYHHGSDEQPAYFSLDLSFAERKTESRRVEGFVIVTRHELRHHGTNAVRDARLNTRRQDRQPCDVVLVFTDVLRVGIHVTRLFFFVRSSHAMALSAIKPTGAMTDMPSISMRFAITKS